MKNTKKYFSAGIALAIALCASVQISAMQSKKRTAAASRSAASKTNVATSKTSMQPVIAPTANQSGIGINYSSSGFNITGLPNSPFTPEQTQYITSLATAVATGVVTQLR